ncbi:DedA family protein [Acidocella facilis]|uniref:DedA family protein n=1 Tax=Acidocella facilis TaxID=525 RepID=UPI00047C2FD5|nr:VTT domain-containing protein [Acidocella facilis]
MPLPSFTVLLAAAAGLKSLQAATIISGTFILEDAATLLAAMQVASGGLSLPLALGSLYAGIVLGDLGLYGLGRLSATHRWAQRLVPQQRRDLGHDWVKTKVVPLVLVSRFVPGLRLPTYTTLGFLRAPFLPFALAAIVATLVWTSLLFYISLRLGTLMAHYLGIWRWAGLGVFLVIIILVGRLATRLYNKRTPQ